MVQASQSPQLYVDVAPDALHVEHGNEGVFLITIENRGREAQAQTLDIAGLPAGWYTVEFDARRRVFPGERRTASLLVKVPGEAEAAHFDFGVTVRAGSDQSTVACQLDVTVPGQAPPPRPVETPQRPAATPPGLTLTPQNVEWRGEAQGAETITVTVRNVDSEDATYRLSAWGVPETWCTLAEQVNVPARQGVDVPITVNPPGQARYGNYTLTVVATLASDEQIRGEGSMTFIVSAPAPRQTQQRTVSPIAVEEPPPEEERTGPPAMPPEVRLGPRSSFRFGPGEVTSQATITITNQSALIERYQILIRGVDENWYQIDTQEVSLQPGASQSVPLRLTPRVGPQFPAGDYSFRVRVAPLRYPDSFAEVAGTLSIAGTVSFDARLTPAQTTGRKEKFKLTLVNTGGLPLSPWLEASDPQGMCKFKYEAPSNLEVGEETVVPIWVGANRQGFEGSPRTYDFRLRVSPAGEGSSAARSFDARFVHQPFLSARMFFWSIVLMLVAAVVGMLFVIGFSSIGRAATAITCAAGDTYTENSSGTTLVKEKCGGAPSVLQKGLLNQPTPGAGTPAVEASPTTESSATAEGTGTAGATGTGTACTPDPDIGLAVGDKVTLRADAIIRETPGGADTNRRGANMSGVITDGPQCAEDLVWWQVQTDDGNSGWTAEQDQNKVRLILTP